MSASGRVDYELSRGVILVVGDFDFVGGIMCWSRGVFSKCGEYGKNKKLVSISDLSLFNVVL